MFIDLVPTISSRVKVLVPAYSYFTLGSPGMPLENIEVGNSSLGS